METSVCDMSQQFTFEDVHPEDICGVLGFAHDVAEHADQTVYVLAFEVDGRQLGDPFADVDWGPGRAIRLGRDDAVSKRFEYGSEVVVWRASSRQWARDLIAGHWREYYMWWGVLADRRGILAVARSVSDTWPRVHGDLHALLHTVSRDRALALLACEGHLIDGRAFSDCWGVARELLAGLAGEGPEASGS